MTVESATYISQLNTSYPTSGDAKSEGDNHLRLLKAVLQAQFPNLGAAAVTPTAAELNDVANKAVVSGDTYSGTHDFTGATLTAATQSTGNNTTAAATTAYVTAALAAAALSDIDLTLAVETGTSVTGMAGTRHVLTNASATTVSTPASPSAGQRFKVIVANDLETNVIAYAADKIMSLAEDMTLNRAHAVVELVYVNATLGWVIA